MTRTNGVRLLLVAAIALLLLTCTVAAWALPHTRPSAPAIGTSTFTAAAGERCELIIGPAHDSCASALAQAVDTPRSTERSAVWPGVLNHRTSLLLFSTLAIAAAIGLVSTAGQRL
ncbi:hypothetical protein [Streptomyces sp. NPDC060031]|uniref:hypothetical protein n=1 Tax=Streptomyces sp. NPDC060031 TaxID=3347043 RepID=UPI0036AA4047